MKRPSNLIISFVMAIAGIFIAYALGRIVVRVFFPSEPEIELEEDYESRQHLGDTVASIETKSRTS